MIFVKPLQPTGFISLEEVFQAAMQSRQAVIPVKGDCMEGRDIMDGGQIAVDFTRRPRPGRRENGKFIPGDPCLCYASFPSSDPDSPRNPPVVMCKQYNGVWIGHMVGTKYKQHPGEWRMDCGFPALAILGVVYASWDRDGKLLWKTDPDTYPTDLPDRCTFRSGNINLESVMVRCSNK